MKTAILGTFLSLLCACPTWAGNYPCNATGTVSQGTSTYEFSSGSFYSANQYWYNNYWARILKTQIGNIVDSNGKTVEEKVRFDLIAESDARGCDAEIDWVKDSDFVRLP